MDDELTPEEKFAAEDAETMVPRALMAGRSRDDVIAELLRLDWKPHAAEALVARVIADLKRYHASPESRQALRSECRRQVLAGVLLLLLSVGIGVVSFVAAALRFYFWIGGCVGCLIVGIILLHRGWTRWRLYGGDRLPFEGQEPTMRE